VANFGLHLTFPDDQALRSWASSTPRVGSDYDIWTIPNDAPPPPPIATILPGVLAIEGREVLLHVDVIDPWSALAAAAHAFELGGRGNAFALDVPFRWDDTTVALLLELRDGGIRDEELGARIARAYASAEDVPALADMKVRMRKK